MKGLLCMIMGLWLAYFVLVPGLNAAESNSVGIYPANYVEEDLDSRAWFKFELDPGDSHRSNVVIWNKSATTNTYTLYSADAVNSNDGVFSVAPKGIQEGAANWIEVEDDRITLTPDERKEVGFVIRIPDSATPGDHTVGIMVEEDGRELVDDSITVTSRVGVRLYMSVSGEKIAQLLIGSMKFDTLYRSKNVSLVVDNLGNVNQHVQSQGHALAWNGFKKIATDSRKVSFAGKKVEYRMPVDLVLPIFAYMNINHGVDLETESLEVRRFVFGLGIIPVFILALALAGLAYRIKKQS